ncbi:MAG: hypothetical protein JWR35_2817, partial [Marmoricola sp.]|nr:hypothetical protein [Marmoricola sp.]
MPPLSDNISSRRDFLKRSGLVVGSAALLSTVAGCGFGGSSSDLIK